MPPTLDPRVDAYIERAPEFARPILEKLRRAFHKGCPRLTETIKWGNPHFEYHGLLGGMAAFTAHVNWSMWRGKQLGDPDEVMRAVGNCATLAASRIERVQDLPTQKVLVDYIKRAAALNEQLAAEPKAKRRAARRPAPRTPPKLAAALKKNRKARLTFEAFPPSHKREYVQWITEAKREETRDRRLRQAIEWLAEGKSRNWKYEAC